MMLETLAGGLLLICMIVGIALVFFGLPGTYLLLFGALLYDLITLSLEIGAGAIIVLSILVAVGEGFGAIVKATGTRFTSSFIGNAGALLGSVGGAVLGISQGLLGIIIGILTGGALGALFFELVHYLSVSKASRASIGAFFGATMGTFLKFELAMVMILVILLSAVF
jgi:uncharacterized protein